MFRITIDNEEVLCDKDITIKEEMLNTPSVILNNVYPKTWEASKDYTTNFYHPDDYSKCIIADQDYIDQSNGTTVDGSNLQITYDDRRNFKYYLKGDTYQYTTNGNQLVNFNNMTTSNATYTFTNDVLTITSVNTNAKSEADFSILDIVKANPGKKVKFSYSSVDLSGFTSDSAGVVQLRITNNGTQYWNALANKRSNTALDLITYTIPSDTSNITEALVRVFTNNGTITSTSTTKITKPLVYLENNNVYEPYTNGASPNPSYPQEVVNATGRQDIQVCGKNLFDGEIELGNINPANGTLSASTTRTRSKNFIKVKPNTTYTFTRTIGGYRWVVGYTSSKVGITDGNFDSQASALLKINTGTNSGTFTTSATTEYIKWYDTESTNLTEAVMINEGSTATEYEAYKGQSYEINLGKNLFDYTTNIISNSSFNNTTMKIVSDSNSNLSYCKCEPNTTYTISRRNPMTQRFHVATTESIPSINSNILSFDYNNSASSITITTPSNAHYIVVRFIYNEKSEYETYAKTIQIEKGSVATSYAPYKTPIELCKIGNYQDFIRKGTGKNLFSSSLEQGTISGTDGQPSASTSRLRTVDYINVKPSTTYSISYTTQNMELFIFKYKEDNTYIERIPSSWATSNPFTFTTDTNTYKIKIIFSYLNSATIVPSNISNVMLCEGTDTKYEPYGYKDKWYLYKAIGKVVLNGSESGWNYDSTNSVFLNNVYCNGIYLVQNGYSNYFTNVVNDAITNNYYAGQNLQNGQFSFRVGTKDRIYLKNTAYTNVNDFKTWLSTHNTTVYYVLSTPYTMEITDSELLGQLESVSLLSGINNITVSSPYRPAILNLHYNFNDAYYYTNELYFCGVVKNSGNISLNPREPHFQTLQILDFKTFLSEGETLDRVIVNKTILETIQEVVGVISGYGFVLGNVQIANPNEIIGAYSTENKTAYDIFNYIAEITQSKWTTRLVDENTVAIDFYDPSALPQGTPIEYNTTYFKNNQIDNMFYSYSANDYRNKQIMTSKEVFANIDTKETIISSGYGSNFLLQQPVGQVESIKLNNVEMSFATKQDKELGYSADFYYSVGSESIESDINIPLGSAIVVQYIPIVAGRQVIANDSEISRISGATGRNGIITRYETRNDASTSNELQMIGQSYIKYKGSPEIKLTVETRSNLWKIGDRVQFNAPIPELATEYMVKSKQIEYIKTIDDVFYTFEMSSSFNSEQDINYFDNQRAKANGNIKEGSYISRNIDIENVANIIFQNATLEKINSTGDNKLNSTLNSPLVQ